MSVWVAMDPFPHFVLPRFASPSELAEVGAAWPGDDWPGWVRYDPGYEAKKASDLTSHIPTACSRLLARAAALPVGEWLGMPDAVADLSLWGGGLHEMPPGGSLGIHLDADGHPRLGLVRAWSAMLYVHEQWSPSDGGELVLHGKEGESPTRIPPAPGTLVAFDCRDCWHEVARLRHGSQPRRSLAIFGYLPRPAKGERPRAHFAHPAAARR